MKVFLLTWVALACAVMTFFLAAVASSKRGSHRRDTLWAARMCVLIGLLAVVWLFAGCASSSTGKALNVGLVGAGVLDLHSTRYALDRGAVEANPVMGQEPWRQAVAKTLGVSAVIALTGLVEMKGRPVLAHVLRSIAIAGWSVAALHNYRLTQR